MGDDVEHAGDEMGDGSYDTPPPRKRTRLKDIVITKFVDADQVQRDLAYTMSDLSDAMMKQASRFAEYGVLFAKASRQVDKMKLLVEATEGTIYRVLKSRLPAGERAVDASLKRDVAVHAAVLQVRRALADAEEVEAIAKIACEAFRHRKDMLVQHGATEREELKGEVRTMQRNHAAEISDGASARFLANRRAAQSGQTKETE